MCHLGVLMQFQTLAHDVALHIAFASPIYVDVADIPAEVVEEQRKEFRKEAELTGKPEHVLDSAADAKPPKDATRPGGNARSFDWPLLKTYVGRTPWGLAGGLTRSNVAKALKEVRYQAREALDRRVHVTLELDQPVDDEVGLIEGQFLVHLVLLYHDPILLRDRAVVHDFV